MKRVKVYGDFHLSKITLCGLRALYFRYLHMLRRARRQEPRRVPFVLREDLRRIDEFSRQTVLLVKNAIETPKQLAAFSGKTQQRIDDLTAQRAVINNRLRRSPEAEETGEWKAERAAINAELKKLRGDLKTVRQVSERSEEVQHKTAIIRRPPEKKKVKEKERERER